VDRSVHLEQDPLVNRSTSTMAVAKTEALAVGDKLVATTRGRQMGTDNSQLRQWQGFSSVDGTGAVQCPHGSIVGAREEQQACCSVGGGAVVGRQWR
jgi:hypothetical protein